jgi:acetolactate synthase-1/3 small subunit
MADKSLRTFVAYVEDKPGVLDRIASLFRRRNFNIETLTVTRSDRPGVSRITVEVLADDEGVLRIESNLYKLVNVLWVQDITLRPSRAANEER